MQTDAPAAPDKLRTGWTTGACATAAAVAAAYRLLGRQTLDAVHVSLPRGREARLAINDCSVHDDGNTAEAGVIKDAGDDPDATHGARVWVRLALTDAPGVVFEAGPGVGTVTRAGLALAVGEPAINPVPRRLMREHLAEAAKACGYTGGFVATVGIDDGERIAEHTMNARLGILGGLSILGTTGIVRPFSCAAYIASIHQAIDVARANGLGHIAACTGSTSEASVRERHGLADMAVIEMGDFAGAVLKYLRRKPVPGLSLVGGFGKFSKLAAGRLDLHSRRGGVDFDFLAGLLPEADVELDARIRAANTSLEAEALAAAAGLPLAERVADRVWQVAARYLSGDTALEVWLIDKPGRYLAGHGDLACSIDAMTSRPPPSDSG